MFALITKNLFLICVFLVVPSEHVTNCPRLITDFHQKDCTDKSTNKTAYYLDKSQCIPRCAVFPADVDVTDCTNDPEVCLAGYECAKRCGPKSDLLQYPCETDAECKEKQGGERSHCGKYCVAPDDNSESVACMAYHSNMPSFISKWWSAIKFKPVCDDDDNWEAKQCKGGLQGRCMCYGSIGIRLFGQALYSESENMTCACSKKKSDLEAAGREHITFHCDSVGNYETLQCDMEKEICWCAEPKTGELTAPFVPEVAKKKLPCYLEGDIGTQYLRQCESKKFAEIMISKKLKAHGAKTVASDPLLCDADGSYGAYSITNGIAYCTWRNNSKIGTWQTNLAGLTEKLTCNCARDFQLYNHQMECEGTGNYVTLQSYTDDEGLIKYYCVDDDGFPKTDLLEDQHTNCSLHY